MTKTYESLVQRIQDIPKTVKSSPSSKNLEALEKLTKVQKDYLELYDKLKPQQQNDLYRMIWICDGYLENHSNIIRKKEFVNLQERFKNEKDK
nr:hypothetical protein [Nanoarchaeota archaeon]